MSNNIPLVAIFIVLAIIALGLIFTPSIVNDNTISNETITIDTTETTNTNNLNIQQTTETITITLNQSELSPHTFNETGDSVYVNLDLSNSEIDYTFSAFNPEVVLSIPYEGNGNITYNGTEYMVNNLEVNVQERYVVSNYTFTIESDDPITTTTSTMTDTPTDTTTFVVVPEQTNNARGIWEIVIILLVLCMLFALFFITT